MAPHKSKATANYIGTYLPDDLVILVEHEMAVSGKSKAELLRDLVTEHFYGRAVQNEKDAMSEVKMLYLRYMYFLVRNAFIDWNNEMPKTVMELRRRLQEYDAAWTEAGHRRTARKRNADKR